MGNVTKAFFYSSKVCKTEPLFQYDYGQILQFVVPYTLPPTYEVHFSNQLHGTAKPQIGNADGVAIPDEYLETGETIYAWLFLHTGPNDGETELTAIIPVKGKSKTTNTPIKPVQQDVITETIAALNSGVERAEAAADEAEQAVAGVQETVDAALEAAKESGEFDGKDGTDGTDGIDGVTFTPSVSPSGVLSWTNDGGRQNPESVNIKGAPGQNGLDGMDGVDGKDGKDGKDGLPGKDGADGSPGASAYVWIRYAAAEPTQDSDMKTTPDAWMGIYSGDSATAPTAYTAYTWYNIKGQTGPVQDVQVNGTSVVQDGVANVQVANSNELGVAKFSATHGVGISAAGLTYISGADSAMIKNPTGGYIGYRPIVVGKQHESAFYGLAKAADDTTQSQSSNAVGNYTESAKSAIHEMLNGSVSVTGTAPVITALAGIQYICGECATLDITLPASGCIDVVFESGSTPTVLTITPPTGKTLSWTGDFDPTALEADTVYEINVAVVGDKCLGVAGAWT